MKKIISIFVIISTAVLMVGCGENQGEFPEINENEEVFMTTEELENVLTSIENQTQSLDTMLLSMNLDISVIEEYMDIWTFTKIAENTADINIQSKTYISLSDDIKKVQIISKNVIDGLIKSTDFEDSSLNEEQRVTGTFDTYFTDQYLYYNADLKGGSMFIDNGKYQMNVAITQSIWDDFFVNTDDTFDGFTNIDFNALAHIDNKKMLNALYASEMIKVYQNKNKTTIVLDTKKNDLLDHAYQLLNGMYDTSAWTTSDFNNHKINNFEIPLDMFEFIESKIAFVIEDNQITKIGCQVYAYIMDNGVKIEISGTFVFDMLVDMPKMPNDLDEYELTEIPLNLF
ncbi:hypothetical protein BK010_10170 [Tenericutes bacterium MO-XQ]|nr:hypothetical protein BK010_10170 [Tenericutes bacterium MO-XQ]